MWVAWAGRNTPARCVTFVVTFSQAKCTRCNTARAAGRAFQLPASLHALNRMFSFAAFITACTTVCVI